MSEHPTSAGTPTEWTTLIHAGVSGTFMRLPHLPPVTEGLRATDAKAAIYGIPWEASMSRSGANYGPRQIREISCQFTGYNARLDIDLLELLRPVDCGDCIVAAGNAQRTFERAQADLAAILGAGALPVTFGGDHAITIPAVRAVGAAHANPGLVLVDAHLDTAPQIDGDPLNHACPIARAVDAGFDPAHMVLIGISGWMNPRSELDFCREHGITIIWLEDVWERGTAWAVERAREIAADGTDGVYLTVDVDAMDLAHAAGTCAPTPGGLTSREAIELVRGVASAGLLGVDVVETAPSLEATAGTSLIAARLAIEAMAYHAVART